MTTAGASLCPYGIPLPPEVLQQIVPCLDPISLITLSQTSRSWRALINPLPHDFNQRLLALELQPQHGGLVPLWDENRSRIHPPWEDRARWKTAKYACCGCMKLLTHHLFNIHSILRRFVRKPPPESDEAKRMIVTDWEPLEPHTRRIHIHQRVAQEKRERKKWIRIAAEDFRDLGTDTQQPSRKKAAQLVNKHLAGTARHKRRCNECMYHDSRGGSTIITRRCGRMDKYEQFFPGLVQRPARTPTISRSPQIFDASLSIIRCESCGVWQHQMVFQGCRFWELRPLVRPLHCDSCRLKADDDYATTRSRELIEGFLRMLNNSLNISRSSLVFGWKYLYHHFYVQRDNWYTGRLLQYKGFANDIFDGFKWEPQDSQSNMQKPFVEDSLLPDLRRRFLRYKDFIYNKVPEKTRTDVMRSVYTLQDWTDEYDSLEEDYRELKRQVDRFKSNPELVVDYVREKQPYRLG